VDAEAVRDAVLEGVPAEVDAGAVRAAVEEADELGTLCQPLPEFCDQPPPESFLYTVSPLVA
jgi:hypothetical protein